MKKSIIFIIILILALVPLLSITSSAEYYNIHLDDMRSKAYYLVNTDTGTVVFAQNENEHLQSASLVKIVTAIVAIENFANLDENVTVNESALTPLDGVYCTTCDLEVGEMMSMRNLLYLLIVDSGNDAANVIAEGVSGSISAFVDKMNEFAAARGCMDTVFKNPTGLDCDGAYSTAKDMSVFTQYAMSNSIFAEIASIVDYTVPATNMSEAREISSSCGIIEPGSRYYFQYAQGGKAGSTDIAARCAAITAKKNSYSYVGVVLGCPNECIDGCGEPDNTALYEVRRMFRWVFNNLSMVTVANTGDKITDIPVSLSTAADHVRLEPEKRVQALLLSSADRSSFEFVCKTNEDVQAPVNKGDLLGTYQVIYAKNVIAEGNLVAGDSVPRSGILYIGHIIKNIVTSPVFIIIASVVILTFIFYISRLYYKKNKQIKETRRIRKEMSMENEEKPEVTQHSHEK